MAPRPSDETGGVLHAFMNRVKTTLHADLFDKFVNALSAYRAQDLAIDELVDMVSDCFDHRKVHTVLYWAARARHSIVLYCIVLYGTRAGLLYCTAVSHCCLLYCIVNATHRR